MPSGVFRVQAVYQYEENLKHGAILYNEAEVFSLSVTNPNRRPMLPFDWFIHSSPSISFLTSILRRNLTFPFLKFCCFVVVLVVSNFFALNMEQFEE